MKESPSELYFKIEKWQKEAQSIDVFSALSDSTSPSGVVYLKKWNQKSRFLRSLKFLGIIWLLAIGGVFLPVIHFVLVPLLVILGPVLALIIYKQEEVILGGLATCPYCKQPLEIVRSSPRWPLTDLCTACRHQVSFEKVYKL